MCYYILDRDIYFKCLIELALKFADFNNRLHFIHGYGGDGIFTHTALYSAPPPNTRLTYNTVWFSFEGGKDAELR
jgi:hypothetical protein